MAGFNLPKDNNAESLKDVAVKRFALALTLCLAVPLALVAQGKAVPEIPFDSVRRVELSGLVAGFPKGLEPRDRVAQAASDVGNTFLVRRTKLILFNESCVPSQRTIGE